MMMAMTIYFRLQKLVQKVYIKQWHESLMDSAATLLMRTFANVHCFGGASMRYPVVGMLAQQILCSSKPN
jgi:hypothetical protein